MIFNEAEGHIASLAKYAVAFFRMSRLPPKSFILGPEATVFFLEGGEFALAGEGLATLGFEGLFPGADEVLVQAEGAGWPRRR